MSFHCVVETYSMGNEYECLLWNEPVGGLATVCQKQAPSPRVFLDRFILPAKNKPPPPGSFWTGSSCPLPLGIVAVNARVW